jgi:hypothetical protein
MSKQFKVGDEVVVARKLKPESFVYGFNEDMEDFRNGDVGTVDEIYDGDQLGVSTKGSDCWTYALSELKHAVSKESTVEVSNKLLYSVQNKDGFVVAVQSRQRARELKALAGGKKAGVVIVAYQPVKEIR